MKNFKTNYHQFSHTNSTKMTEFEKKLQGLQVERIYSEIQLLRETTDQLRKDNESHKQKFKELRKQMDGFVQKDDIMNLIDQKIKQVKDDILAQLKEMEDLLSQKADLGDIQKIEKDFVSKLEEVVQALVKQLANKQESKKALIYLEQKINQIFLMLEGQGQKDGDGYFVKRQLWSCASCDKELDKFQGNLGDYRGWAVFPPKETSPERMGKFGVGYKNMQEKVKVNREKLEKDRYNMEKQQMSSSGNNNRPASSSGQGQSENHERIAQVNKSQTNLPYIKQKGNQ